tara:strand:+ start:14297 stop:14830 length:534 start_codon:yes stop_codon:yes gene_type:complete
MMTKRGPATFSQLREMSESITWLLDDDDDDSEIRASFLLGIDLLEAAAQDATDQEETITAGAFSLTLSVFGLVNAIACRNIKREQRTLHGLMTHNKKKAAAMKAANQIAANAWSSDASRSIRIGEMCEIVWAQLVDSEHRQALPNKAPGLRAWIKAGAPEYSRQGGRAKKNLSTRNG